jgi:hypothetical protein
MLPLASGNFAYPTSFNEFYLRGFFLGFFGLSNVYLTICAIFWGKNRQIFWYHKIEKKEGTYLYN